MMSVEMARTAVGRTTIACASAGSDTAEMTSAVRVSRIESVLQTVSAFFTKTTAIRSFGHGLHTFTQCLGQLSLPTSEERYMSINLMAE